MKTGNILKGSLAVLVLDLILFFPSAATPLSTALNTQIMKTKILTKPHYLLLLLAAAMIIPSCDWFRVDPEYIGTWQYTEKTYAGEVAINITHTLKLTENTFEEVIVYRRDNSSSVMSLLGLKGNIAVDDNEVIFTLTAIGECLKDSFDKCTSAPEWFLKGSPTYNGYLQLGISESFDGTFEAYEDYLWLVRDLNNDTDTDDDWEDMEFERL